MLHSKPLCVGWCSAVVHADGVYYCACGTAFCSYCRTIFFSAASVSSNMFSSAACESTRSSRLQQQCISHATPQH